MPFRTPLQEAVAELNFASPALAEFRAATLYERIGAAYPDFVSFPFLIIPQQPAAQGTPSYPYGPAYRFLSRDGGKLVQYGPRLLSYNCYKYPGWDQFKEDFVEVFRAAVEAGLGLDMERLALTYMNRMPAVTPFELQRLLRFNLNVEEATTAADFIFRKTNAHADGLLSLAIAQMPPDQIANEFSFSVTCTDVRFIHGKVTAENLAETIEWFERAHHRVKALFWSLLSNEVQEEWKATYHAAR